VGCEPPCAHCQELKRQLALQREVNGGLRLELWKIKAQLKETQEHLRETEAENTKHTYKTPDFF